MIQFRNLGHLGPSTITNRKRTPDRAHQPGIDSDEVKLHRVCAARQAVYLCDVGTLAFDIVTTTDFAQRATCSNFAAVPALELLFEPRDWTIII